MGSYTCPDFLYYLKKAGHTCKTVYYHFPDRFQDDFFCERFTEYLTTDTYDAVLSINFFPLIANLCYEHHIKYLSWIYDSPMAEELSHYFHYETNYIFHFDRSEVLEYQAMGYTRIFHLPLAVNTERLDTLTFTPQQIAVHSADISFVGQLYASPLQALLYSADDFVKGYIEGILQSQLRIYGYYLIDGLISDELLDTINTSFAKVGQTSLSLTRRGLSYAVASEVTHLERLFLLEQLGELFSVHFYSSENYGLEHVKNCGPVKYTDEMSCVFRYSKLNLNPTLKCIRSGIPLRALDIMGAGGALLSNYQPELAEYFENEKDIILYESMEDAIEKADFYLKHDNLRKRIAQNGNKKIRREFTYPQRIQAMFKIAQLM